MTDTQNSGTDSTQNGSTWQLTREDLADKTPEDIMREFAEGRYDDLLKPKRDS
ncbi:hypothetical protein GCM10023199_13790 [Actinomycetospora chibensis]